MDWPVSEERQPHAETAALGRGAQVAQRLFGAREHEADAHYITSSRPSRTRSGGPRRRRLNPVSIALGLGGVAIAILLVGEFSNSRENGRSVSQQLPHATANVGTAVTALPPPNLLKPLSPEEALKENAERPFVTRPDTPAGRFVLKTDSDSRERALNCLTQAVYYEAASEGADGGRAVAQVVLNRMRHPGYPASVCGVIYQGSDRITGCQFTFTCDGSLLRTPVASLWTRSRKIAEEALAGRVFAPIGHATHYHADYVLPYWADTLDKTVQIGRHIFYRFRSTPGDSRAFFQRYAGSEPLPPKPADTLTVEPGAASDQLAATLLGDSAETAGPQVEKVAAAAPPLLADAAQSKLVADGDGPVQSTKKRKPVVDCAAGDQRKVMPLGADNMRAGAASSGC